MLQKKQHTNSFISILKGEFVSDKNNKRHMPFLLMLVLLILLNISLSFRAEQLLKQSIFLEKQIADLRLVHITTKSELMHMYRRTVIEELVGVYGLKSSITPPIIIEKKYE